MLCFQLSQIFKRITEISLNNRGYHFDHFTRRCRHSFANPLHQDAEKSIRIEYGNTPLVFFVDRQSVRFLFNDRHQE